MLIINYDGDCWHSACVEGRARCERQSRAHRTDRWTWHTWSTWRQGRPIRLHDDYLWTCYVCRPGTDLISLLILFFILLFGGDRFKSPNLRRFKSDRDEIPHSCSSQKYASNDGVGFSIWRHTFTIATMTMTLFHAEKCCHLVTKHTQRMTRAYAAL